MYTKSIRFFNERNEIMLDCKLNSLPFKEVIIIEKCMELFSDPEPCIIHRSFAIKKMLLEIDCYFNDALQEGKGQIKWELIPQNIRELLSVSDNVTKIQID